MRITNYTFDVRSVPQSKLQDHAHFKIRRLFRKLSKSYKKMGEYFSKITFAQINLCNGLHIFHAQFSSISLCMKTVACFRMIPFARTGNLLVCINHCGQCFICMKHERSECFIIRVSNELSYLFL